MNDNPSILEHAVHDIIRPQLVHLLQDVALHASDKMQTAEQEAFRVLYYFQDAERSPAVLLKTRTLSFPGSSMSIPLETTDSVHAPIAPKSQPTDMVPESEEEPFSSQYTEDDEVSGQKPHVHVSVRCISNTSIQDSKCMSR